MCVDEAGFGVDPTVSPEGATPPRTNQAPMDVRYTAKSLVEKVFVTDGVKPLLAVTVKLHRSVWGVPDRRPVGESDMPAGKLPSLTSHVSAGDTCVVWNW